MIALRDLRPEDEPLLLRWRNLPEVAAYMYSDHEITPGEHGRWFASLASDPSRRYWVIVCDDEDVGVVNLYDIDSQHSRCFWAFYLASPSVRGKGVGSFVEYSILQYVFDELSLDKLSCEVLGFNEPVVNMHRRFGFQQEGLFRRHIVKSGEPMDVVRLAILREEWAGIRDEIEDRLRSKGVL